VLSLCQIDWQALATLATGILAVGAAIWVALKQNDILRKQAQLSENDLKVQLLDKRIECISLLRPTVGHWSREARLDHDHIGALIEVLQKTEILYPSEINARISSAVSFAIGVRLFERRSREYFELGNDAKGNEFREKSWAEEDKLFEKMENLLDDMVKHTRIDFWESPRPDH
jgi:hypothetical protein